MDPGMRYLWSFPTNLRTMCGPSRPMKATIPMNDTTTAVSMAETNSVSSLSRSTFTPSDDATSSPASSAL